MSHNINQILKEEIANVLNQDNNISILDKLKELVQSNLKGVDEYILPFVTDVYGYQDTHAERIISYSWNGEGGNVWRYKFENAGDILRELSKYKNSFIDPGYLFEKVNKIEDFCKKFIGDDVHPDDQYRKLKIINYENLNKLRMAYLEQPVISEAQRQALNLIIFLIDGKLGTVQEIIKYFNNLGGREGLMKANYYDIPKLYEIAKRRNNNTKLVNAVEEFVQKF